MKIHFTTIGLAFYVFLAPIGAFAQDTGQAGSSLDGTATAPDGTVPDTSANPFTGAAGASKFYQDNSLTGATQSDNTAPAPTDAAGKGSTLSNSNPPPTLPTPDASAAAVNANPFAGAAGANRFYQDNSLTGSMPTTNLGTLGGMGGMGGLGSNATSWATTP